MQLNSKLFLDQRFEHTVWQVLLVGEDEYDSVAHLPIVDNSMQLLAGFVDAVSVRAVHHKYEALGAWKQLIVRVKNVLIIHLRVTKVIDAESVCSKNEKTAAHFVSAVRGKAKRSTS